ncbi:MAG: rhodanese-like domain-containing protein [Desulfovibrio sp.]|uniref:rhodanese-like domain-containing protein n=1 Tax=Desulfovibrio sp. 7SRBS1 TaxID=3378064 RepID=UPI003B3DDFBE
MKTCVRLMLAVVQTICLAAFAWAGDIPHIDTAKVSKALSQNDWMVVDTRLNDAFNGWRLDGVKRGGHITGAVDFSANWLKVDAKNLEALLQEAMDNKGLRPEKNVVLYDATGKDAAAVAAYLQKKGFGKLYFYDVKQWAADPSLPMTSYPKYRQLVPAVVLKEVVDGKVPETFDKNKKIIVIEASWGEEKTSYAKGHIPGTFHINTDRIEPPTKTEPVMWVLGDDATLKQVALDSGITRNDTVIVTSEEPLAAFRVATVLRYIGVDDVRVLNGGTLAWTLAGFKLETKRHAPTPVKDFGGTIPGHPDVIDTMEETKAGLAHPDTFTLVDNRTWKEHIGEITGYSYHKIKGRIPGSVYGYAGKNSAYDLDYFRNPDKTMRNAEEFLALWKKQGIDTTKHLSFMCGSGWRVAEIYYYADTIGLPDIAIFSDGWIGWSNTPGNPIVTGVPK